jgi:hypothetical protein
MHDGSDEGAFMKLKRDFTFANLKILLALNDCWIVAGPVISILEFLLSYFIVNSSLKVDPFFGCFKS